MLTEKQALERIKETRDASKSMRRALDSYWTLAIAYDAGEQWTYGATERGQNVLRKLSTIIDPNRPDVRATMNLIHSNVRMLASALKPHRIASNCNPASGSNENRILADLGDQALARWLPKIDALRLLRDKDLIRLVLGTAIIRRTLSAVGPVRKVGDSGTIRDFQYGWAHAYPWEIIRDPSATSTRPDRDEDIFIQEKPRSTAWLQRHFGVRITTDTTLGKLLDYQRQIHMAHGITSGACDLSKIPAVTTYEAYFKSPGGEQEWSQMCLAWCDPAEDKDTLHPIRPEGSRDGGVRMNPFHGLPYHFFTYDTEVQAPWGVGVPHLQMQGQDICNLAWTWLLRIQQAGAGQIVFEKGSIERPERQFSGRMDRPIEFQKVNGMMTPAPTRLQAPQVSPVTPQLMDAAPAWMQRALNISDVQRGVTSKRGESGTAVEQKLGAANAPLDQLRRDDDLTYQELLYASLADLANVKRIRLDQAKTLFGEDVPDAHVKLMLRKPITEAVSGITIHPAMMHPKTPGEVRDDVISLANAQIIPPEDAQWEMINHGVQVSSLKVNSKRKQEMEIEAMKSGDDVAPAISDNHASHLRVLSNFLDSPQSLVLDDEARDRLLQHWALHFAAQQQQMLLASGQGQPGQAPAMTPPMQGSPPAEAAQMAGAMSAGTVGPEMTLA